MKTLCIILASLALASCGIPVAITADYTDPETGLTLGGGYSSKGGIVINASK